jgi:hypothetical protein
MKLILGKVTALTYFMLITKKERKSWKIFYFSH